MRFSNVLLFITILAIALVSFQPATAADVDDYTVSIKETETYIVYYGTVLIPTASATDNHFTQWMYIGDCNDDYGWLAMYANDSTGTEDVNVSVQYSNAEKTSGVIGSATIFPASASVLLDQVTATTMQADTVGVVTGAGDGFKWAKWARLKLDGQTGNPQSVWNWWFMVKKKTGAPKRGVAGTCDAS